MAPGGTIEELWRYPVKSMLGERVVSARVTARGLAGDRAYALIDVETGKVASAKLPRRWGVLFSCRASFLEEPDGGPTTPPVRIELAEGTVVRSDEPGVDDVLSTFVGRRVHLTSTAPDVAILEEEEADGTASDQPIGVLAPKGTFFDGAPVHLITSSSIATFTAAHPTGRFDPRRFRVNLVVDTGAASGFVENSWVGRRASLGTGLELDIVIPVPRCVMTTLAVEELPADKEILQTANRENRLDIPTLGLRPCAGVYGIPVSDGVVTTGDPLSLS